MTTYTYKYKEFTLTPIPNDMDIKILSYMTDSDGFPLLDINGDIDFFTVSTKKSSLPANGFESFLSIAAASEIASHFDKTISGSILSGGNIVTDMEDTTGVLPGMRVINESIQDGTTVESIRDLDSVRLSVSSAESLEDQPLLFNTLGWTLDLSDITYLVSVVDFSNLVL